MLARKDQHRWIHLNRLKHYYLFLNLSNQYNQKNYQTLCFPCFSPNFIVAVLTSTELRYRMRST